MPELCRKVFEVREETGYLWWKKEKPINRYLDVVTVLHEAIVTPSEATRHVYELILNSTGEVIVEKLVKGEYDYLIYQKRKPKPLN